MQLRMSGIIDHIMPSVGLEQAFGKGSSGKILALAFCKQSMRKGHTYAAFEAVNLRIVRQCCHLW